jgi:YidC/Oxa1 family membrane protein insertase
MTLIYWAISWIMLKWHAVWDFILPGKEFLATNWDWILAIVFLVLTVRGLLFPVFVKQIKSQRAMQAIAPQIKELQEKHKGDRATLQQEMMSLYKKEKANPMMGCLPLVVQIPVFLGLYHVLRHLSPDPNRSEANKTLYGWTVDQFNSAAHAKLFGAPLSAAFKSSAADLTALGSNSTTVKIVAAVLVLIMMVTTFLTSRQMILKTGWSQDPQQRMVQKLMLYGVPGMLLISGFNFPIGVVIYWVTTNLFSLGQQFWVLRKFPPPVQPGATPAGRGGAPAATTRGLLGRRQRNGVPAPSPVVENKALAPKPGAKPANPKGGSKPTGPKPGTTQSGPKPGSKPANPKKGGSAARRSG